MIIKPLNTSLIAAIEQLIASAEPYVRLRSSSDYWLYSKLFSGTCPVALHDDRIMGVVIAFRSQDDPGDVYIQDVVTHPEFRRHGVARALIDAVRHQALGWGCRRLYLTSEPGNDAAHVTWASLGFSNVVGDRIDHGVSVISNYKGHGKDRAVYEYLLG